MVKNFEQGLRTRWIRRAVLVGIASLGTAAASAQAPDLASLLAGEKSAGVLFGVLKLLGDGLPLCGVGTAVEF